MNRILKIALSTAMAVAAAFGADFTYEQKSEVTGGSMKQMMSMMGRFSKGASGPQTTTTYLSGGKMATQSARSMTIMDASAGTMTSVDLDKKEYSVITFEEMAAALKKMQEKMSAAKPQDTGAKTNTKVSLDEKGPGRTVAGVATRNMLMKIDTETTVIDKKTGKEVTMNSSMENDMHVGKFPGSEAFQEFAKSMQGRFPIQQVPMQAMMQGGVDVEGMKAAGKKMAELQGFPLYSVLRVTGMGMPGMPPPQQQSQGNSQRDEAGKQIAGSAAESAAAGRMGRFGGLAGLGRRAADGAGKKPEQAPPPQADTAAQPASAGSNVLMEMTTEVTSFSSKPVDASVFAVPAGFKQVESPMKKMAQ
ncbi:MAG: hypothetical protein ABI972_07350 [Acidobacteriota bacterium]